MFKNRRTSSRQSTFIGGYIIQENGTSFECIIRNVSECGARLDISDPTLLIGASFILIDMKNGKAFEVQSCWRRGKSLGVLFKGVQSLKDTEDRRFERARQLWMAKRQLSGL